MTKQSTGAQQAQCRCRAGRRCIYRSCTVGAQQVHTQQAHSRGGPIAAAHCRSSRGKMRCTATLALPISGNCMAVWLSPMAANRMPSSALSMESKLERPYLQGQGRARGWWSHGGSMQGERYAAGQHSCAMAGCIPGAEEVEKVQ